MARLAQTVDLPTPPLQEVNRMVRVSGDFGMGSPPKNILPLLEYHI
jgi:hypothetical protein